MTGGMVSGLPEGSIFADELGFETGRLGAFHLKSVFCPVFRVSSNTLIPSGVEAAAQAFFNFNPVPLDVLLQTVPGRLHGKVGTLCLLLHIANAHHIVIDGFDLYLSCGDVQALGRDGTAERTALILGRLAEIGISRQSLICAFSRKAREEESSADRVLDPVLASGVRIAVDEFGPAGFDPACIEAWRPHSVRIDGGWFRRVIEVDAARRLCAQLVEALQEKGIQISVGGIQTPQQLHAALEVGVDCVGGPLFSRPAQGGSFPDFQTLEIDAFFREPEKVVIPLR
ncbi:EAL domain-containing protein [uncultured Nitratireductor sp.]|uniref:EAL domain-containing protein n=1 Tax=uncultured Nitratireductor sp. TaxID=520953 RepID=UPI0025E5A723|nr:EAL domain-containing protein [uncultured Nitratireductor sp.]